MTPQDPVTLALAGGIFAVSVVAGTVGSLFGLGGGVVVIPALTLLFGVDIRLAIGASLVSVVATSSGAAAVYLRDRMINLRLAMLLEIATAAGALSGAHFAGLLPAQWLFLFFAALLAFSAFATAGARHDAEAREDVLEHPLAAKLQLASTYPDASLGREVSYTISRLPLGLSLMYGAGVASGLLGIGAGALKMPAMDRVMRVPIKVSSATSNMMMGVTAAASAFVYFMRGEIAPRLAAPVALGVLLGATLGTRLLVSLPSAKVRLGFAVVLCFLAIQMVLRGLGFLS